MSLKVRDIKRNVPEWDKKKAGDKRLREKTETINRQIWDVCEQTDTHTHRHTFIMLQPPPWSRTPKQFAGFCGRSEADWAATHRERSAVGSSCSYPPCVCVCVFPLYTASYVQLSAPSPIQGHSFKTIPLHLMSPVREVYVFHAWYTHKDTHVRTHTYVHTPV